MELETICVSCMEDDSGSPVCPQCGSSFHLPVNNLLLLPPRTILREQYLIGRALGHGGFGITYLAWDVGLHIRLAVKEYMPAGVAGRTDRTRVMPLSDSAKQVYEWGLERFIEEARVLKKSNHPSIVPVDTVFRDNGTAYLVMEYLEGTTFAEFLGRRGDTILFADALRIMSPVMDALMAVHAVNIVHRDVSPDNIFIPKMGRVKLIDFGAARNALNQKSRNLSVILKKWLRSRGTVPCDGSSGTLDRRVCHGRYVLSRHHGKGPATFARQAGGGHFAASFAAGRRHSAIRGERADESAGGPRGRTLPVDGGLQARPYRRQSGSSSRAHRSAGSKAGRAAGRAGIRPGS